MLSFLLCKIIKITAKIISVSGDKELFWAFVSVISFFGELSETKLLYRSFICRTRFSASSFCFAKVRSDIITTRQEYRFL